MHRLPPVDENSDAEVAAVFAELSRSRGGVSNALRSMGHAPEALRRFAAVGEYARYHSSLPERLREIVIVVTGRKYAYAMSHHGPLAIQAGVTEVELADLVAGTVPSTFTAVDAAVARYVLEFASPVSVSDQTFETIKRVMTPREITDVTMTSAYYVALAMIITAFGVTFDSEERLKAGRKWQKKMDMQTKTAAGKGK